MRGKGWLCAGLAGVALIPGLAQAEELEAGPAQTIIVTAPGGAIDVDDALSISGRDIGIGGTPDLLGALTRNIAGITLQDAQNNPWQPNLVYRGFVASPLQGQAQGLAVYMDGARFNQPFGDTVQFDLIPEAAIRRLSLLDASPVYGLNALGGAILLVLRLMKRSMTRASPSTEHTIRGQIGQPAACMMESKAGLRTAAPAQGAFKTAALWRSPRPHPVSPSLMPAGTDRHRWCQPSMHRFCG